jgi:ADP-heptose:LPS heptosyltransferase
LFVVRYLRKKNKSGSTAIIVLHKLGDSIFTVQAISKIISIYAAPVFIICFKETSPIFKLAFKNPKCIEFAHDEFYFNDRIASRNAKKKLEKLIPYTIYDLTGNVSSISLIFSSKAKKIIGINDRVFRKIYDNFVPIRSQPHVKDIYLDAVREQCHTDSSIINLKSFWKLNSYILIHPFAGWKAKEWNLRKFICLAERLAKSYHVIMLSAPNKFNKDIIIYLENKHIKLVETKSIDELIEIIKNSTLFIGNDSGPIHIANLLGIPTFTIYGPTNPDYHKPTEGLNGHIMNKLKCSPKKIEKVCFTNGGRNGCPFNECMFLLEEKDVYNSVQSFIDEINKHGNIIL